MLLSREMPVEGGKWFRREVQGAVFEVYGVPQDLWSNGEVITVSPERDALYWLFAYTNNRNYGEGVVNTLSDKAIWDLLQTTPYDFREIEVGRTMQGEDMTRYLSEPVRLITIAQCAAASAYEIEQRHERLAIEAEIYADKV